jgi:Tfp pilus assembly pilus retraction ATPase PilT
MRDSFPYESNAFLISLYLVPDPLSMDEWEQVEGTWETEGKAFSLLEWIIHSGQLTEPELKQSLEKGTGRRTVECISLLEETEKNADARVLENNGFITGRDSRKRRIVTGGSELPPDLSPYLGEASQDWEWVMISPLRKREPQVLAPDVDEMNSIRIKSDLAERLESILIEATTTRASDIHFELYGSRLLIRCHGLAGMEELAVWDEPASTECLRLLKRWANISTAESSLPQDGRLEIGGTRPPLSFRVSHIRAVNGESLVLRVIGKESFLPDPEQLGLPRRLSTLLKDTLLYEHGLALCTGATGSGKTTTMCAVVSILKNYPLKILTIEDPIEYELSNATQCSVDLSTGWTFSKALGAFLRQDPDIILVGEIRDRESAAMACRAGLTGHCVLSSLHARSVTSALDRLQAWGLAPGLLAESLRLVIYQQLKQDMETGKRTARFDWIQTEPDTVSAYLAGKLIPESWILSNANSTQEAFAASANA